MNNKCVIYKFWIFDFLFFKISDIGLLWSKTTIFIIEITLKLLLHTKYGWNNLNWGRLGLKSPKLYLFAISGSSKFIAYTNIQIHTWILWVALKQLRLLHGRVGDSTTVVNSLSPQMSELVKDDIASWCGDIVENFWLVRNGVEKLVELIFIFFSFKHFRCLSDILATSCTTEAQM